MIQYDIFSKIFSESKSRIWQIWSINIDNSIGFTKKLKKAQIFSKFVQGFKGWVFVGLDRIQRIEDRVEDRIGTYVNVVYLCLTIFWQIIIAVK